MKDFFKLLLALVRLVLVFISVQVINLLQKIRQVKERITMYYWKWKFPEIKQMRKLSGDELLWALNKIKEIREPARMTFLDDINMSNSQRKKTLARVHNEEKKFMENHDLVIFYNELYKKER